MKNRLTLNVVMLIIVTFFTAASTFAFFTTQYNQKLSSDMNVTSAIYPSVVIINEKSFFLSITNADMLEGDSNSNEPSVTTSNEVSISFTTSETGGNYSLDYYIYYEPINVYTKSLENTLNKKEFVVSIISNIDGEVVSEFNLNDVDDVTLLYTGTIVGSGVEQTFSEYFTVEFGYYNQDFDQSDNAGQSFGGFFVIETEEIKYE